MHEVSPGQGALIRQFQKDEITGYIIYKKLANRAKKPHNKALLLKIAENEKAHYNFFKTYSNTDVAPNV